MTYPSVHSGRPKEPLTLDLGLWISLAGSREALKASSHGVLVSCDLARQPNAKVNSASAIAGVCCVKCNAGATI